MPKAKGPTPEELIEKLQVFFSSCTSISKVTPVSKSLNWWVVVSNKCSVEACKVVLQQNL